MVPIKEQTTVVIIGAGASGLTTANFLALSGIRAIVLESRSLAHIEERQRAGTVEARAVRMFEQWGIADKVIAGPPYGDTTDFRIDGVSHIFKEDLGPHNGAPPARFCPQQVLVRNLIRNLQELGSDVRFEAADVAISDLETETPAVTYRDTEGTQHEIRCDFVAGCDGFHGVSRKSIPEGVLSMHSHEYGISWLNILAEAQPSVMMATGFRGFAAQFPRGALSRFYLQCEPTDTVEDWPDDRIWNELRLRLGMPELKNAPIDDRMIFPLRSVVFEPMRYRNLFLVGDAAHIISPVGGKGMNLALFDAETFVLAVRKFSETGDTSRLDGYSDTCLHRTWNYQEYSAWCTEMLHDPADMTNAGSFRANLARARLSRLLTSTDSGRAYSELAAGLA
ncbi:4-hydroxybenzoate 3-monooxygenase [Pannonibacter sp. Q-1]|jgi:p-hydroxybenzoate 3-monooxygenase